MITDEPLIDAHCHIDLFERPAEIVAEAERERVYTIAVTNAPSVFEHTEALARGSRYVRPALGLHPELVSTHAHEAVRFPVYLPRTRYIGEIGLDYVTSDKENRATQRRVLGLILDVCATARSKILTVHSRRAAKDVISAIGEKYPGKVILHWFSGSRKELELAIRAGFCFSVNSAMASSERGRALVEGMPPERVLTETDGPFGQVQNRRASPSDVKSVLPALASIWKMDTEAVRKMVLMNFRQLLDDAPR
jgi:TatD DNase family protein